jgi:hypothetical protein
METLREAIGAPLLPYEHAEYDRHVTAVRVGMGDAAFVAARAVGKAMTPEQAVADGG